MTVAGKSLVRIGCGASSWGDDIAEPRELLSRCKLDYLVMDYLAEVTMSILRRRRNPKLSYASFMSSATLTSPPTATEIPNMVSAIPNRTR